MSVLLKGAAMLAVLSASAPADAPDALLFVKYPLIHRVDCDEGRGTAFRVGVNHWLSVAHVTGMHNCTVDGNKIAVTEQDGGRDFARFDTMSAVPNGIRLNCHGFIPGHWYWSIGYARGAGFQTAVALYATYAKSPDGKRALIGPYNVIPGMSGGPIVDEEGEVVGTVNAYIPGTPISLSRELKDTSICGADIA
jgi:hypothetical protein